MHVDEAQELLALDVFNTGARQITLCDVEHYLSQLRSHSPECRCGRCQAAAIVRPDRVLMIVRSWQRQARATTVRALCADSPNRRSRTAIVLAAHPITPGTP